MRKRIFQNWALKLASLVLAAILWFVVVTVNDPMDVRTYYNVPVRLTNTDLLNKENKVYEVLDNTDVVNVTVRAPKSVFSQLRTSDIVAEADMSKLTDINTIGISFSVQNVGTIESIEGNHDVVRLSVEEKRSKWVKLVYKTIGEVADGYIVAGTSSDQTLIEVTGPKSVVDRINYAGVEIDVSGATNNLSANVDISLYDEEDNLIDQDNIKTNVNFVHMTVDVLATKEVPVEVNYMGIPANGYMVTGAVQSDPATVRIAGTPYALSNISKISIPEDRLNITAESSNKTDVINLREFLPDNIKFADSGFNGKVTVTVYIEPKVEKTLDIPADNVKVINVPQGMEVQFPEDKTHYTMQVSGLNASIEPLRENLMNGTVDVAAWMEEQDITELTPGVYILPVEFNLPEDVTGDEITVQLTFSEMTIS